MKIIKLPDPPNPDDRQFIGNTAAYHRAVYKWQNELCGRVENASLVNNTPADQAFVTGTTSFALTTFIAATSTGTDITNFIVSLVNAMQKKGLLKAVNVTHE